MKLKLLRLGKSYCKGPLNDHALLERPWHLDEDRTVDDSIGHSLMAKYPGLFKVLQSEDKIFDKIGKKPKNKIYTDRLEKPKAFS